MEIPDLVCLEDDRSFFCFPCALDKIKSTRSGIFKTKDEETLPEDGKIRLTLVHRSEHPRCQMCECLI